MVRESGVELLLHAWGTQPIMHGDTMKGVVFESKSGRQAVLGKVVIDSTRGRRPLCGGRGSL